MNYYAAITEAQHLISMWGVSAVIGTVVISLFVVMLKRIKRIEAAVFQGREEWSPDLDKEGQ